MYRRLNGWSPQLYLIPGTSRKAFNGSTNTGLCYLEFHSLVWKTLWPCNSAASGGLTLLLLIIAAGRLRRNCDLQGIRDISVDYILSLTWPIFHLATPDLSSFACDPGIESWVYLWFELQSEVSISGPRVTEAADGTSTPQPVAPSAVRHLPVSPSELNISFCSLSAFVAAL